MHISEAHLVSSQTSTNIKLFTKIANDFKSLLIFAKSGKADKRIYISYRKNL